MMSEGFRGNGCKKQRQISATVTHVGTDTREKGRNVKAAVSKRGSFFLRSGKFAA